jgi:hypothetical protein
VRLSCPRCGREIPAPDIDIHAAMAKCGHCGEVFGFAGLVPESRDVSGGAVKPPVGMPKGVAVERDAVSMTIVRSWFHPALVFLVFFCVAWDSFLVFWYAVAARAEMPGPARLLAVVFPAAHVAVGLGLTYYVLCGFLNKTRIRASRSELDVSHGPLPWYGARTVPAREVDQLFCREKGRGKEGQAAYIVSAVLRDGKRIDLVSDLQSREQARYIEQEVERYLGIADRPVSGEARDA